MAWLNGNNCPPIKITYTEHNFLKRICTSFSDKASITIIQSNVLILHGMMISLIKKLCPGMKKNKVNFLNHNKLIFYSVQIFII